MKYENISCVEAIKRICDKQINFTMTDAQLATLILIFGEEEVIEAVKYYAKQKQIG